MNSIYLCVLLAIQAFVFGSAAIYVLSCLDVDCNPTQDTVMTLAVAAVFVAFTGCNIYAIVSIIEGIPK